MDIWLYDGQFPLLLSVNPEDIFFTNDSSAEVYTILNKGQVTELKKKTLQTFRIKSFWTDRQDYPYVQDKYRWYAQEEFMKRIEDVRDALKPINVIIADTYIDIEAVIERFEWGYVAGSMDIEYEIDFREYRKNEPKFLQNVDKNIYLEQPARSPSDASGGEITIGATVIVNGQLHRDSYGTGPGQTESNETRKVNFINLQGSHPYHITDMDGGWRGWVTKESVRLA